MRWRPEAPSIYLPNSGQIDLNAIGVEAGQSNSSQTGLNDSAVRNMISKASGAQNAMNEYYGVSNDGTPIVTVDQQTHASAQYQVWTGCNHPSWGFTKKTIRRWGQSGFVTTDPSSYVQAYLWRTNDSSNNDYGFAIEYPKYGSPAGLSAGKNYKFVVTSGAKKEVINVASISNEWYDGYEKVVVSNVTKTDIITQFIGQRSKFQIMER